jgi:hypothetical protein
MAAGLDVDGSAQECPPVAVVILDVVSGIARRLGAG